MKYSTLKDKIWHIIAIATFVTTSIIILTAMFWLIYPYKTADLQVPIEILNPNKQVKIGEPIIMKIIIKKYIDTTPKGDVYLKCDDGSIIDLQALTSNRPAGNYTVVVDKYKVPERAVAGTKCTFNFRNSYQVNPIREVVKDWYSEEFEVIK